jgi:hypothetical protein
LPGPGQVATFLGVEDRFGDVAVLVVPGGSPAEESTGGSGVGPVELGGQHLLEEVVVAIAGAVLSSGMTNAFVCSSSRMVEVDPSVSSIPSHSSAENRATTDVFRRKRRTGAGLPGQDLVEEVVGDLALFARELGEGIVAGTGAASLMGQRGEADAGRLARGLGVQGNDRRGVEAHASGGVEGVGSVDVHGELIGSDLDQLAVGAAAGERDVRIGARGEQHLAAAALVISCRFAAPEFVALCVN